MHNINGIVYVDLLDGMLLLGILILLHWLANWQFLQLAYAHLTLVLMQMLQEIQYSLFYTALKPMSERQPPVFTIQHGGKPKLWMVPTENLELLNRALTFGSIGMVCIGMVCIGMVCMGMVCIGMVLQHLYKFPVFFCPQMWLYIKMWCALISTTWYVAIWCCAFVRR